MVRQLTPPVAQKKANGTSTSHLLVCPRAYWQWSSTKNSASFANTLLLQEGKGINWDSADVTLTQNADTLTLAGGGLILPAVTTAQAPLTFTTGGTLLTTPVDGAIEMDADAFYGTTDASNRGYIPVKQFIRSDATRTFTSNTSQQAIWTSPTNGRLTLETGTYRFEMVLQMDTMSGTTGNGTLSIIGAGTATVSAYNWVACGADAAQGVAAASGCSASIAVTSATPILVTATGATMGILVTGSFEVTGAGTIIPSFAQQTAAAAVVKIGSYFMCERIGSTSVVSVGQWD